MRQVSNAPRGAFMISFARDRKGSLLFRAGVIIITITIIMFFLLIRAGARETHILLITCILHQPPAVNVNAPFSNIHLTDVL